MSSALSLLPNYDLVGSDYSLISGKGSTSGGTSISPDGFSHSSGSFAPNYDTVGSDYSLTSGKGTSNVLSGILSGSSSSPSSGSGYYSGTSASYVPSSSTASKIEYIDAPYAQHYKMNTSTAYNEALANTAYQRKVKDLLAAGLNPVLGISGSGANSFYGTPESSGFSYGSGGYYGYGSSGSASASQMAQKLGYWLPTLANGIVNMTVSLKTGNSMSGYGAGQVAQNVVSGILSAVRNHF